MARRSRSRSRSRKRRSRKRSRSHSARRASYRPTGARRTRRSRSRSLVRIGPLRKGTLGKYGYKVRYSTQQRHDSLKRAALSEGYLPIFRKLIAVSTLQKNRNPAVSHAMRADAEWVKAHYKSGS